MKVGDLFPRVRWPGRAGLRLFTVAAAAALIYAGCLGHDFVLDAVAAIRDNPVVHRADVAEILTTDYWAGFHGDRSGTYRPLPVVSWAATYRWFGTDPRPYHLLDLLLHVAASLLWCRVVRRLSGCDRLAWWSGLLFAVHPVASEAVVGMVGRADLLAALLGFIAVDRHLTHRTSGSTAPLVTASAALAAALLSKESAVAVPGLIALIDLFQYRTFRAKSHCPTPRAWLLSYVAYSAVTVGYLAWRHHVLGGLLISSVERLDNPLIDLAPVWRPLNALGILLRSLGLLVLPVHLSADYSYASLTLVRGLGEPRALAILVGVAGVIALLAIAWRRLPWVAFGLGWVLVAYAPVSNLAFLIGTAMAERLLYLPLAGFCVAIAATLQGATDRRTGRVILPGLVLLLAGLTVMRVPVWRDAYTLFSRTVEVQPCSARAWHLLGQAALARGDDQRALSALNRALAILPEYFEVRVDLGNYHFARGEYAAAARQYTASLEQGPRYPPAWLNLGLSLYHLGRRPEARRALEEAVALDSAYTQAHYNLGVLDLEAGELQQARDRFERVLALEPDHEAARANLDAVNKALARAGQPNRVR